MLEERKGERARYKGGRKAGREWTRRMSEKKKGEE